MVPFRTAADKRSVGEAVASDVCSQKLHCVAADDGSERAAA